MIQFWAVNTQTFMLSGVVFILRKGGFLLLTRHYLFEICIFIGPLWTLFFVRIWLIFVIYCIKSQLKSRWIRHRPKLSRSIKSWESNNVHPRLKSRDTSFITFEITTTKQYRSIKPKMYALLLFGKFYNLSISLTFDQWMRFTFMWWWTLLGVQANDSILYEED